MHLYSIFLPFDTDIYTPIVGFINYFKMNTFNYIIGSFVFLTLFALSFQAPAFEDSRKVPIWPAPVEMKIGSQSLWLDEFRYNIKLASNSSKSTILKKAAARTAKFVRDHRVVC